MAGDSEPAPDLYRLLAVPRDATGDAIARAYRRQARLLHPDSRPHDTGAAERFRALAEAYQVLSDPGRRAAYDRAWRGGRSSDQDAAPASASRAGRPPLWPLGPALMSGPVVTARPGMAAAHGLPPGAPLWASPVRVDPPGPRPDSTADVAPDRRLAALAQLLRLLGERGGRPW